MCVCVCVCVCVYMYMCICLYMLHTRVNTMHNQGINEFLSVHAALLAFDLAPPRNQAWAPRGRGLRGKLVVKHTGRYAFEDALLFDVVEANPGVDLVVRLDQDGRALFTGALAVRAELLRVCMHVWVGEWVGGWV